MGMVRSSFILAFGSGVGVGGDVGVKVGTGVLVAVGSGEGVAVKVGCGVGVSGSLVGSSIIETAAVVTVSASLASGGASSPQAVSPRLMIKKNIARRYIFIMFPDSSNFKQCWKLYATCPKRQSDQLVL
jgi:hypothetical protein